MRIRVSRTGGRRLVLCRYDPYRWYSVNIGSTLLALILDSNAALKPGSEQREWFERQITDADKGIKFILIVLHYPPVRDPFYPAMRDEQEVSRYLSGKPGLCALGSSLSAVTCTTTSATTEAGLLTSSAAAAAPSQFQPFECLANYPG